MGHPKMQHPLLKEPSKRTTYSSDSQTFSACGALKKKKKKIRGTLTTTQSCFKKN